MDEHVLSATIAGDEAVAPLGVEPFHRAGLLDGRARRWPVRCRRPEVRSPWRHRSSGAAIDADDLGDVWSLVAGTDPHFEGFARLHGVDPALSQHAAMKEGVPGPIGEFDEAKALLGIEPFDDSGTGGPEGASNRGWLNRGRVSESTGLWVVGVGVEVATPRMTKILISHFGSWWGGARSVR